MREATCITCCDLDSRQTPDGSSDDFPLSDKTRVWGERLAEVAANPLRWLIGA